MRGLGSRAKGRYSEPVHGESVLREYRKLVEPRLDQILPDETLAPASLHKAMRYSVLGGGKRLRPALSMASSVAVGGRPEGGVDVGCAAELVHCFSLVHDDLPSIDDDDLRRGRATVHKVFGEAIAVLAGDALFALAFQVVGGLPSERVAAACLVTLARASGGQGLVGGEVLDVESEGGECDLALVELIHRRKTGALISAACEMGGRVGGGETAHATGLARFGMELGLAFQIVDDILNETGSTEQLGKSAGSDRGKGKLTYPRAVGLEESNRLAKQALETALIELDDLPGPTQALRSIAIACVERDR